MVIHPAAGRAKKASSGTQIRRNFLSVFPAPPASQYSI
jgi:hypothetical protein